MEKIVKEWKSTFLLSLLILGLAFFLRTANLTELPIFADEAIYVRWAQVMRAEPTLRFVPLSDGKQPLFMWAAIPFLKVFENPMVAGRFLSALTGLGTAIGVFVASYLLFKSKKVSLAALLIYAISPFSLFFDRMALVDSMLTMFGVWTFIGGIVTAKTKRLDVAMITGFFLGAAFLTKSPALFFFLLLPFTYFLTKLPKKKKKLEIAKLTGLFGVTSLISYGMYNILRLGPNFHLLSQRNKDYVHPMSHILESPLDPLFPHVDRVIEYLYIWGPSVIIVFLITGLYFSLKKDYKKGLLLLLWGLGPIVLVSAYTKVLTARYVLFALPFLYIIASASFFKLKDGIYKKAIVALFIFFIFHSFYVDRLLITAAEKAPMPRSERSGYLEEWTAGHGMEEIAEFLEQKKDENPETAIVVGTEGFFGTLPDGLQIHLNDRPDITVIGVGLGIKTIPEQLVESRQAGNLTYLVANNERLYAEVDEIGGEIVAVYPKAVRPDGSRQTLLFIEITEESIASQGEDQSN